MREPGNNATQDRRERSVFPPNVPLVLCLLEVLNNQLCRRSSALSVTAQVLFDLCLTPAVLSLYWPMAILFADMNLPQKPSIS